MQASETQMVAKSQTGHLGYDFLIVAVTHYSCKARVHAFFLVRTHSLFYSPGIVRTGGLEWEKIKCQSLEREEIVVERWRMECKGSRTM